MTNKARTSGITAEELKRALPNAAIVARDLYGVQFRRGSARCMFHDRHAHGDRNPSLKHDAKKNRLFCASQECTGTKGVDAIGLVQLMDGCSFTEAVERLADHYGVKKYASQAAPPRVNRPDKSAGATASGPLLASRARALMAKDGFHPVAEFYYGENLRTVRFEDQSGRQTDKDRPVKNFRWEHQCNGTWYSGDGGIPKPLYVNGEFRERDQVSLVIGFEGEAKADLAGKFGLAAFSFKNMTEEQARTLADCDVTLWPDNDQTGLAQAATAAKIIADAGVARSVRLLKPPEDFPVSADIIDAVNDLEWDAERVKHFLGTATPADTGTRQPATMSSANGSPARQVSGDRGTAPGKNWPEPLREEAFHGVVGEMVQLIEPHSEADPAALLVQFLVMFGNLIGRHAHFTAEADRHFTNLFAVLVGQTAKGRKGTSLGQIRQILAQVDPVWASKRDMGGLASGEGLIWAVRDEIHEKSAIKVNGRITGYQDVIVDAGEDDKRLMVVEPEFARVLQASERESNTLSAIIRQAWDTGNLRILTKNKAACATEAQISIIGHITSDELRRLLSSTAAGNGFANRFLWVCTRRSKLLPEGGALSEVDFGPVLRSIQTAADFARTTGKMNRDNEAKALWAITYAELSDGKLGLLGAVTSRAESQVMRMACVYALLDCSATVRSEHLRAALAVWRYCMDSAAFIFGDALGDPTADAIMAELRSRPSGMARHEIRDFFARNKSSPEIERALSLLQEHGLARMEREREQPGQIRPTERWFAITTVRG